MHMLTRSVLVSVFALSMVACDSRGNCEKRHDSVPDLTQACVTGAEPIVDEIIQEAGGIATSPTDGKLRYQCTRKCAHRYNPDHVGVGNDPQFFDEMGDVSSLFGACEEACEVSLKYQQAEHKEKTTPKRGFCEPLNPSPSAFSKTCFF